MLYRHVVVAPTFAGMTILGIIEDQAAVREALRTYLGAQPEVTCALRELLLGAVDYLGKTTPLPLLKEPLRRVAAGGSPRSPRVARHVARYFQPRPAVRRPSFTRREAAIVRGIEDGLSCKLIVEHLGLRLDRVRSHIRRVYRKLEVNFKIEIITQAYTRLA